MDYFLTDSHAHYDDEAYDNDRDALLEGLKEKNVKIIINAAQNVETSKKCIALAEKYDFIYAAVGIHPENAREYSKENIDILYELSKHPKVVAIGESGLDFHYGKDTKDIQIENFIANIELAEKTKLPLVIHDREAHQMVHDIIKEHKKNIEAVFHCYSGSPEMAKELAGEGYMFSFGGVCTFKNAINAVESIKIIPMERIMLETDSPYLSPEPNRGKRNDSSNIEYIASKIAEIKGMDKAEVCNIAMENLLRFYRKFDNISTMG